MPTRILLKTTIGPVADGWNVGRFSLLSADVEYIARVRRGGGATLLTRDHQDLGACLTRLGALGLTQYFHASNPDPDESRRCRDDLETPSLSWPNFHSGANGDLQTVSPVEPLHPLMSGAPGTSIRSLPAHPHEGSVGVPRALRNVARVVARGRSLTSVATFNLYVAVEEPGLGRAVSDSNFHHFCDCNWDPRLGCPSFVNEPPGAGMLATPDTLRDVHRYVGNIAARLAGRI